MRLFENAMVWNSKPKMLEYLDLTAGYRMKKIKYIILTLAIGLTHLALAATLILNIFNFEIAVFIIGFCLFLMAFYLKVVDKVFLHLINSKKILYSSSDFNRVNKLLYSQSIENISIYQTNSFQKSIFVTRSLKGRKSIIIGSKVKESLNELEYENIIKYALVITKNNLLFFLLVFFFCTLPLEFPVNRLEKYRSTISHLVFLIMKFFLLPIEQLQYLFVKFIFKTDGRDIDMYHLYSAVRKLQVDTEGSSWIQKFDIIYLNDENDKLMEVFNG